MLKAGSPVRKAFSTVSILWLGSLGAAGLTFLIQVVLARGLTPERYGLFAATLATITLLAPVAGFGIPGFWLKVFGEEGWGAIRWLPASFRFVIMTTTGAVLSLAAWATWGPHDSSIRLLFYWLLPVTVGYMFLSLVSSKLQLEERYGALTAWQVLPNIGRFLLVMIVFVVTTQPGINVIAAIYSLVAFAMTICGVVQLRAMYQGRFTLKGHSISPVFETEDHSEAVSIQVPDIAMGAWPFGLSGLFHLVYFQSDIILLKYLAGNEIAAIYNVAFVVMAAVYLLPSTIYQKFLLPKVHRWANSDRAHFLHVYRFGNGVMLLMGGITTVALIVLVPLFIPFLFGGAYQGAVGLLAVLAFCAPLRFLASSVGATLVTQDHMRRKNGYMGIVAVFNVLLNLLMIPRYGAMGSAVATLLSEIAIIMLYLIAVRRHVFGVDAWRGWTIRYRPAALSR